MALYRYLKAVPKVKAQSRSPFLSALLVISGGLLIANGILPIALYQFKGIRFRQKTVVVPVESFFVDYDQPTNWFPSAPKLPSHPSKITAYNLSIPKLKIDHAVVKIGGESLSESLVHYPGTALPGQYGNGIIFGHSVLPQFFNPKNYKTIFSTLPTLKEGDEILVDFDGVLFRYQVIKMVEVMPNDVSVLEQRYDNEYLNLVTCVPPGTYLRRLIVRARLVNPS